MVTPVVSTPNSGLQTFNTAYPFNFAFQNQFQGQGTSIFYIVTNNDPNDAAQQVKVVISKNDQLSYTWKAFATTPATPDSTAYHLAMAFKPGVLSSTTQANLSGMLKNALSAATPNATSCNVNGPITRSTDGALVWYCAFTADVSLQDSLGFMLDGFSADAGIGSRSTLVEFSMANVLVNNTGTPMTFTRNTHVDIINHQGSTYAPIYFSVLGSNTLQNQSGYVNDFKIYFEAIGRKPLSFSTDTEIEFAFHTDQADPGLMFFGSASEVQVYTLAPGDSNTFKIGTTVLNGGVIRITATNFGGLSNVVSRVFHFSNVQISDKDGIVMLNIHLRNVPGYWDTDFQVPLIKKSSETIENLTVTGSLGIGTTNLTQKLHVEGDSYLNGNMSVAKNLTVTGNVSQLKIDSATANGHLGTGSRVDFLSSLEKPTDNVNVVNVSIEENFGLNLYADGSGRSVKVHSDLNVVDSKDLNVSGNAEIQGTLTVDGSAEIKGTLTADGSAEIKGPLKVDSNLTVAGRITDTTGPVMPVGVILPYVGITPPTGWLICNGDKVDESRYPDLFQALGGTLMQPICVPDLRGYTMVGAGDSRTGGGTYTLRTYGGEVTHKLTTDEMPSHSHTLSGGNGNFLTNGHGGNTGFSGGSLMSPVSSEPNTNTQGANQPHNNMPPYFVINYIIKC